MISLESSSYGKPTVTNNTCCVHVQWWWCKSPLQPFFGCHATLRGRLWCSLTASDSAFIIINFLSPYRVRAVDTQGRHTLSWFVSTYRVTDPLYKSS